MKILSDSKYKAALDAREAEIKGYYQNQQNEQNIYLEALARQIRNQVQSPNLSGITRDQIVDSYKTNGVLGGIVSYIASAVGEMFSYLEVTRKKDGSVDDKHWLNDVLSRPNDRFNTRAYGEAAYTNYALFGDQWNYAPKAVGANRGKIGELYCIPSQKIAVNTGDYNELFKGIKVRNKDIEGKDVFEVFDYNIDDDNFFGQSKVVQAALYLSVLEEGMNREATSLINGGPANLISPKETAMPALPQDKDSAEQELNAHRNINKNIFLRMGVDVKALGDKPVDLNILSAHKEAATILAFVYNFPIDLIYGQSKYENAREAKKAVYEQCAIPFANKWGAALASYAGIAKEYEITVNTDHIDILHDNPYDVAAKMNAVGAFTTNEIRNAAGWQELDEPWANEVRLPLGVQIGNEPLDINEI